MSKVLLMLAKAFDTKGYPDDKNPDHWRKMNGLPVHLDVNGHIDGGAGGKFKGTKFGEGKQQKSRQSSQKQAAEPEYHDMFNLYLDDEFKKKFLNNIEEMAYNADLFKQQARYMDLPFPGQEGREEAQKKFNNLARMYNNEKMALAKYVMELVWYGVPSEEISAAMKAGKGRVK